MAFTGFTDRVVQYPGRVVMNPVSGEENTYDMSRAEGTVTEEGTPFNAETFNAIMQQVLLAAHPVGSYLWTSDQNYDPGTDLGGTWEKIDPGVTLVSAGTGYTVRAGTAKDGGEATVALTVSELPAHKHTVDFYYRSTVQYSSGSAARPYTKDGSQSTTQWAETRNTGSGAAHENMPPYKAAYCWHRIA